jgi:hypothetical protein
MNRKPWLMIVCSTLLAAVAVIGITAGCGKGKEAPVGTDAAPPAALLTTEAGPAGHWEADIIGDGPRTNRVTLDLAKNAKSEWIASMGLPSENMTGMVVTDVAVNGKSVKFVAVELMMASFDLTLGPEGNMKGKVFGHSAHPVEFKRTGEAKVELIPASPAVSKELEGDWEASIGPPDSTVQLVFHFKNQPDNTVAATIDSRNASRNFNAVGMPLNDVKQTGQKVAFGIKIGGGGFEGTMNTEGTEIAGQLTGGPTPTPLTLRKK